MAKTETMHIRIDPKVKTVADKTLNHLGMSTTEAITIFLHQVILHGGLPFAVKLPTPNEETLTAMQEARDIASGKKETKAYHSVPELMKDLTSDVDDSKDYTI
jgi:DNA-damage-inducible protein J